MSNTRTETEAKTDASLTLLILYKHKPVLSCICQMLSAKNLKQNKQGRTRTVKPSYINATPQILI